MLTYSITTLVDITENGLLRDAFPFTTKSGELVHDGHSLGIAKRQQANFTTMVQLLQLRSNIVWELPPKRKEIIANQHKFGTVYEGKHTAWQFAWQVEQSDLYSHDADPVARLNEDFNAVPVVNFCKETATFPVNAFITHDHKSTNTLFNYLGSDIDLNTHIL